VEVLAEVDKSTLGLLIFGSFDDFIIDPHTRLPVSCTEQLKLASILTTNDYLQYLLGCLLAWFLQESLRYKSSHIGPTLDFHLQLSLYHHFGCAGPRPFITTGLVLDNTESILSYSTC